jgi:hypothetical protein
MIFPSVAYCEQTLSIEKFPDARLEGRNYGMLPIISNVVDSYVV